MDDSATHTMSGAEATLRAKTDAAIERVQNGATIQAALRAAGYSRSSIRRILAIGNGGEPSVTDEGLRDACRTVVQAADATAAEVDAALAERWKFLASVGDDWRSIAELLKRRSPEEWNVAERSEIELSGGVEARSEDATLAALARLRAESGMVDDSTDNDTDEPIEATG